MARKQVHYTDDQQAVALAFMERIGDYKAAARKARVPEEALRTWHGKYLREQREGDRSKPPKPFTTQAVASLDPDETRAFEQAENLPEGITNWLPADVISEETHRAIAQTGDETAPVDPFARPYPPEALQEPDRWPPQFAPAPGVEAWLRAVIVDADGPLYNPDQFHFELARVGVVWTNVFKKSKGNLVAGTAEIPLMGGKDPWSKGREAQQLREWFGEVPDFLITLDAVYCALCSDREFCALVEHEMFHCFYKTGDDGAMKMNEDPESGDEKPSWSLRGHHVEDFVWSMELYGAQACAGASLAFVEASHKRPKHGDDAIARACGRPVLSI